jgi:hypothetical protein
VERAERSDAASPTGRWVTKVVASKGSRPPKKADDLPPGGISILPMQLQIGDRYTDETGEREVVTRPVSFRGGRSVRAGVQVPGKPETEREDLWDAHQRITVRRN